MITLWLRDAREDDATLMGEVAAGDEYKVLDAVLLHGVNGEKVSFVRMWFRHDTDEGVAGIELVYELAE